MKIPPYHEFEEIEPGLWRCKWCDGYIYQKDQPDRESRAAKKSDGETQKKYVNENIVQTHHGD